MSYAANTSVSCERTELEIKKMLRDYGADGIVSYEDARQMRHRIDFRMPVAGGDRLVRVEIPMPDPESSEWSKTPTGKSRTLNAARELWERGCRARWRQAKLILKAKFEAIESGITTLEREFMPDLVMPDNRTIEQHVAADLGRTLDGERPLSIGCD